MADIHTLDMQSVKDDELLSRFIDGDLDTAEQTVLKQRLRSEPALQQRLDAFTRNDMHIRAALTEQNVTLPSQLLSQLGTQAGTHRHRFGRGMGLALAASVTLAVGISLTFTGTNPHAPVSSPDGMTASLAEGLNTLASRESGWDTLADGSQLRAVLTFPASSGTWCREFMLARDEQHWRGVACRQEDSWVTQVMGRDVFLDQKTAYRPASAGATSPQIAGFIETAATDIALSPTQERQLIQQGWSDTPSKP